jgi:hypothetical protein
LRLEALSGLELQRRRVCLKGGLIALRGGRVVAEILFTLLLLRASSLADANVHTRVVPFFLANDIVRHYTLL